MLSKVKITPLQCEVRFSTCLAELQTPQPVEQAPAAKWEPPRRTSQQVVEQQQPQWELPRRTSQQAATQEPTLEGAPRRANQQQFLLQQANTAPKLAVTGAVAKKWGSRN